MICASPELSLDDLRFVQAYQALRHQLDRDGQRQLRQEAIDFTNSVIRLCSVPVTGPVSGSPDCVGAQYNRQRSYWIARLSGAAYEEANQSIERHNALQRVLCQLGYCASTETTGVYGPGTRAAIIAWQKANGRPATGFIGDDDAMVLERASPSPNLAQPTGCKSFNSIVAGIYPVALQRTGSRIRAGNNRGSGVRTNHHSQDIQEKGFEEKNK
jgi:hypothetical protein